MAASGLFTDVRVLLVPDLRQECPAHSLNLGVALANDM